MQLLNKSNSNMMTRPDQAQPLSKRPFVLLLSTHLHPSHPMSLCPCWHMCVCVLFPHTSYISFPPRFFFCFDIYLDTTSSPTIKPLLSFCKLPRFDTEGKNVTSFRQAPNLAQHNMNKKNKERECVCVCAMSVYVYVCFVIVRYIDCSVGCFCCCHYSSYSLSHHHPIGTNTAINLVSISYTATRCNTENERK